MRRGSVDALKEEDMLRAFRACRQLDQESARKWCPEVVEVSSMLGEKQRLGWEWHCLVLLACAPALSPKHTLDLTRFIMIRGIVWACLCQQEATNSSGIT